MDALMAGLDIDVAAGEEGRRNPPQGDAQPNPDDEEVFYQAPAPQQFVSAKEVKFPTFKDDDKVRDAQSWLLQCEGIITSNDMSDLQIMGAVRACMEGPALDWLRVLIELEDSCLNAWSLFRISFEKRFRVSTTYANKSALIQSLKQKDGEGARRFLDRISMAVNEIYRGVRPPKPPPSGAGSLSLKQRREAFMLCMDETIKILFIAGLRDKLRIECEKECEDATTLDKLVDLASKAETANRSAQKALGVAASETAETAAFNKGRGRSQNSGRGGFGQGRGRGMSAGATGGVNNNNNNANQNNAAPNTGTKRLSVDQARNKPLFYDLPTGERVYRCFNCDGYGHFATRCPQPPTERTLRIQRQRQAAALEMDMDQSNPSNE